jgi:uncharacterized protein YeaO (DUF488 family)
MELWTGRIWVQKDSALVLNTTFKTGEGLGLVFAPSKSLVYASKYHNMPWSEYIVGYTAQMRQKYRTNQQAFLELLSHESVIVTCYCKDTHDTTKHCHRYILVDILEKVAHKHDIAFEYKGEIT